jgi:PAS domain S-box-containing protein
VILWANKAFTSVTGYGIAEALGKNPNILKSGIQDKRYYETLWGTITKGKVWSGELINRRKDGTFYTEGMTITPMKDNEGEITHFIAVKQDITLRKQLESQLLAVSRQAGMAEVASGVLHNVGNVLNSVNVSANVLLEQIRSTPAADLGRVVMLLQEQGGNVGAFFASDPRGPKVLEFLAKLAEMLNGLQEAQIGEVGALQKNLDHIKDIVSMQQSHARVSGLTEKLQVTDLIEDALLINAGTFQRHKVEAAREFEPGLPSITTEKHKVLQILINLVSNARHACDESQRVDKQITVRAARCGPWLRVQVIDNGIGIRPENLNRIFTHGFTTKKNGHGFGLHNSANEARELGGSLTVHSDGPGRGAIFTLELPVDRRPGVGATNGAGGKPCAAPARP